MKRRSRSPGLPAWAISNLAVLVLGCVAWGWLDYRYVTQFWSPGEMRAATDWLMLAIIAASMVVNLWLLRKRSLVVHLLGALAAALAVTALWWLALTLAGGAFHAAIGGSAG
ncbi:MAG: hypothetical protein ACQET0_05770 [Pseudomonadota bacterium]